MADQTDKQEIAKLKLVNVELTQRFARCRALLEACRTELAANSNEPVEQRDDDDTLIG